MADLTTAGKITIVDIEGKEHLTKQLDDTVLIKKTTTLDALVRLINDIWKKSGDEDKFVFICKNLTMLLTKLKQAEGVDKDAGEVESASLFETGTLGVFSGGRSRRLKRRRGRKSRRSRR